MVRDVTNLARRRRIGVVVVPQANGRREKKHNDRDAGCQTPAASVLQTAAWNHLFPHPAKLLQLTSTHASVQGCQEKRYETRNLGTHRF
jgi:hypothetical protein